MASLPEAFQLLQTFCEREGLDIMDSILDAQKLKVQKMVAIHGNSVLWAAFIAAFDFFRIEKESLKTRFD